MLFNTTQTFTNNATSSVYSGGNLTVNANSIANNQAEIYAVGNLNLQKSVSTKNTSITNQMGRIESQSGDVNILTQTFLNKGKVTLNPGRNWFKLFEERHHWDDGEIDLPIIYVDRSASIAAGDSSLVRSGGNMSIIADNFTNDASRIIAGNNLTIHSNNAQNISYQDTYLFDLTYWKDGRKWTFEFTADPTWLKANVVGWIDSTIRSNFPVYDKTPRNDGGPLDYRHYISDAYSYLTGNDAKIIAGGNLDVVTNTFGNSIAGRDIPTASNNSTTISNTTNANSTIFSNIVLPKGDNGLFKLNTDVNTVANNNISSQSAPTYQYLIQTNLPTNMMDQNQCIGSEYFLSRIGYNPNSSVVLVGDPFYQTRFVTDQIQAKLNQKYTESGIGSDLQQVQKLYDNAITTQADLGLQVGTELSQSQIDNLKSDIIWLVEKEVNGQKVLVPEVYLSKLTLANVDKNTGSIVKSGGNLTISSSGDIKNAGTLSSGNNLNLTSNNNILNVGGSIKSKNDTNISASGMFQSITQKFTIAEKFISKGIFGAVKSTGEYISETLGNKASVTTGGNLNITAGSITNLAAALNSGGNLSLTATDGNINIGTQSLRNLSSFVSKNRTNISDSTTNIGSNITSGGNTSLTSLSDINIQGSSITGAGNGNLQSLAGDINITNAIDSKMTHTIEKKKSTFKSSYDEVFDYKETNKGSSLDFGGSLGVDAEAGNLLLQGSDIRTKQDLNICNFTIAKDSNGNLITNPKGTFTTTSGSSVENVTIKAAEIRMSIVRCMRVVGLIRSE